MTFGPDELYAEGTREGRWRGAIDAGSIQLYPGTLAHEVVSIDVPDSESGLRFVWHRGDVYLGMLKIPDNHLSARKEAQGTLVPDEDIPVGLTDPRAGRQVYERFGCEACHGDPERPGTATVGPDLGVSSDVTAEGHSARRRTEVYLKESIMDPDAEIADLCPNGPCMSPSAMPSFRSAMSDQELSTLVGYLMSLSDPVARRVLAPNS